MPTSKKAGIIPTGAPISVDLVDSMAVLPDVEATLDADLGPEVCLRATEPSTAAQVSVYTRLTEFGLLRKLTDIVLAKVSVPWHLRDDAAQEIHTTWAALTAKPNFARNQLARYAYISGQHAALKLRRNIGAVVTIPGALFRTGRDSAFMEAIGAAVNPKDVDDYKDSIELSVDAPDYVQPPQALSLEYFKTRMAGLPLSKSQRLIAEYVLVRRMSSETIAQLLSVRVSYVERLIAQVARLLNAKDDDEMTRRWKKQG